MNTDERRLAEVRPVLLEKLTELNNVIAGCNVLGWIATVLAVLGAVLNNFQMWPCFVLWILSNGLSAWIHKVMSLRSLMIRDLIFLALACVGIWQWTR